jgi:hypothetical protein
MFAEPVKLGHIGHIKIYPEYRDLYTDTIQDFEEVAQNAQ